MADREKAIRGMETHYSEHPCSQCPYRGEERCTMELAADALALLKEQEPRVMTLDEVREDHDRVVWIECDDSKTQNIGQYRGQTGWHANCANKWERFVTMSFTDDYLHRRADKYGKEWRCWTARPTPDQMRDMKWEDARNE